MGDRLRLGQRQRHRRQDPARQHRPLRRDHREPHPAGGRQAFISDRQHQSYSAIAGLGPLADLYKAGAKAVTSITAAPDGIPDGKFSDSVPEDAPEGSERGAGSPESELGKVVELVNTVRGPHASSNPSKYTFQYPRPGA
ncbi:hypothetical protein GCM10029992_35340 [Glycomyces albus]